MSTLNTENSIKTTTPTATTIASATMPDSAAYQLPVNMSTHPQISPNAIVLGTPTNLTDTTSTSTASTTTNRHNVSVTNIKCEMDELHPHTTNGNIVPVIAAHGNAYYNTAGLVGGVRIPVPKAEDSDSETELTNIENLKVTRRVTSTSGNATGLGTDAEGSTHAKNGPRPMSWEGELSESETNEAELMDTEHSLSNGGDTMNIAVIKSEATTTTPASATAAADGQHYATTPTLSTSSQATRTKHSIKSEVEQISVDMHNAGIYSSPHAKLKLGPTQSDPINLKYEPADMAGGVNSPLLARSKTTNLPLPANPSPDSAIHSVYTHSSPSQSPLTSRHAPYTPSLSRNNSDASHSSCYSYSSEFSPSHSPIQARHAPPATAGNLYGSYNGSVPQGMLYRPLAVDGGATTAVEAQNLSIEAKSASLYGNAGMDNGLPASPAGISRQQLINSPCPICGDKISGFHYGIFSCESCKGFFKRTVQNRKNYVCVRGGPCPVSISTRKKCPACRFDKCLQKGMKLEAIREDRTRGGRSTYQCSYTLPNTILNPLLSPEQALSQQQQQQQQPHIVQQSPQSVQQAQTQAAQQQQRFGVSTLAASSGATHNGNGFVAISNVSALHASTAPIKSEQTADSLQSTNGAAQQNSAQPARAPAVPTLLQEIMDVEHLWQYNEAELARLNQPMPSATSSASTSATSSNQMTNTLLVSCGLSSNSENTNPDWIAHLCNVADHRLYKIVKWCKSLPLFKHISIDDQIRLLINSWCELLLFSCCFRSIYTPGEIKLSQGKTITLAQAKTSGLQGCIERMLNLTDHLRRLRVDRYEYVAMKVIVLLQSDTSELQEPVKVRECQEKALQSLQAYTHAHYPDTPSKFGELLLRIPDLQRTYQLGKEMLTIKSRDGGGSDFNLLMELLRGEH